MLILSLTLLVFNIFLLVFWLSRLWMYFITRVPYVPTAKADVEDLITQIPLSRSDMVIDLGSGNGIVLFLIERIVGSKVRGYEMQGWQLWFAKIKKRLTKSSAEFVGGSFFNHSWSEATVIYIYLFPFLLERVWQKAKQECAPGTKIVSRDFQIPNVTPSREWKTPTNHTMRMYIV